METGVEAGVKMDMDAKRELRARMKELRAGLGADARAAADSRIAQRVLGHLAYQRAATVFTYLSVGSEVDTRAIIRAAWEAGKRVAVPRVVPGTRTMRWYAIEGFDGLERSAFGVEEPVADPAREMAVPRGPQGENEAAVALVPGLAFDAQGYRVGYGGGFYDVFLPVFGGVSLGLCREAQFSAEPLPRDEYDVAVDAVICG